MATGADIIIYAALAIGYVAMLALTERSAGRYVRGDTTARETGQVYVMGGEVRPAPRLAPRSGVATSPAKQRVRVPVSET